MLTSWKKMLKNTADRIQDRTTGTEIRELHSSLDQSQGGKGFYTKDPFLTVETLFKTEIDQNGKLTADFRSWKDLSTIFKEERRFNPIMYKKLKKTNKHLHQLERKAVET